MRRLQVTPWWRRASVLHLIWVLPQVCTLMVLWHRGPVSDALHAAGYMATISACLQVLAIALMGLLGGAATFARERELQTMELLVLGGWSADELYEARRAAVVQPLFRQLLACLPWSLLIVVADAPNSIDGLASDFVFLLALYCISRATLEYCVSLGMNYSVTRETSSRALQCAVSHALLLFVLTTIVPIFGWLANPLMALLAARAFAADASFLPILWIPVVFLASCSASSLAQVTSTLLRRDPLLQPPTPPRPAPQQLPPPGIRCFYPGPR